MGYHYHFVYIISGIPLSLDTCNVIWFVGYRRRLSLLLLSLGYVHYFVPGYLFYGSFTYEEYVTGHCRVLVQSLDRVTPNSVASGSAMLAHRQLSPKRIATPSGQVPPLTGLEVVYERRPPSLSQITLLYSHCSHAPL